MSLIFEALKKSERTPNPSTASHVNHSMILKRNGKKYWLWGMLLLVLIVIASTTLWGNFYSDRPPSSQNSHASFQVDNKSVKIDTAEKAISTPKIVSTIPPSTHKLTPPPATVSPVKGKSTTSPTDANSQKSATLLAPVSEKILPKEDSQSQLSIAPVKNNTKQLIDQLFTRSLVLLNYSTSEQHMENFLIPYQNKPDVLIPVLFKLSQSLTLDGRLSSATHILNFGLQIYPQHLELRLQLAKAQFNQRLYQKALDTLLSVQPNLTENQSFYALEALTYLQLKKWSEAQTLYEQLNNLDESNPNYLLGLAVANQNLGETKLALNNYQAALSFAPPGWSASNFVQTQISMLTP